MSVPALFVGIAAAMFSLGGQTQPSDGGESRAAVIAPITVVGTAPLPGLGTPLSQVPANVQTFDSRAMQEQATGGVASFLEFNAMSVTLNTPSGNVFQPDLSFRGFAASPLLGTPQGLSVYQDGVRINEAFADVVHWDLLPQNAIASLQLLPGSNAVFGLNTLGGALSITMKNGFRDRGVEAAVDGGSFGRRQFAVDAGGTYENLGLFVAGEALDEDGWREHSATRIRRLYAQAGTRHDADDFAVAITLADNTLNGTQALPLSMLGNPRQAYSWPDTTENRLEFVNASWQHAFDQDSVLSANAYYRRLSTAGVNSNVNGNYDPVNSPSEAFNVSSSALTQAWGASLQWTARRTWAGVRHQLLAGLAFDAGTTTFAQSEQDATFVGDREAVGTTPFILQTDVGTRVTYTGIYAGDTIAFDPRWTLSVSGRYNTARVVTRDRTGENPDVDGTNDFRRFNPAVGLTWLSAAGLNLFGGVSQGMRVPSPVELTCADPDAPCTLPNIFVADPPLKPVRATTYEAGVRGRAGEAGFYSAAIYRTDLVDDIQFIGAGQGAVNAGYFQNVGNTRRQGIELRGGTSIGALALVASYSYLDATFQTAFAESSPNNVTASPSGLIEVESGDRLPGLPRHTLRLRVDWSDARFHVGASVLAASSQYARGNENNEDPGGTISRYAVVALDGAWRITPALELYGRIDNLFGRSYQNSGILGANYFRGPEQTFAPSLAAPEPFLSPGAPFGVWIGVRCRWDGVGDRR